MPSTVMTGNVAITGPRSMVRTGVGTPCLLYIFFLAVLATLAPSHHLVTHTHPSYTYTLADVRDWWSVASTMTLLVTGAASQRP